MGHSAWCAGSARPAAVIQVALLLSRPLSCPRGGIAPRAPTPPSSQPPTYPANVSSSAPTEVTLNPASTHPTPPRLFSFFFPPSNRPALGSTPTTKDALLSCHRRAPSRLALGPAAAASDRVCGLLQGSQVDAPAPHPRPSARRLVEGILAAEESHGGPLPSGHGGSMREIWSVPDSRLPEREVRMCLRADRSRLHRTHWAQ